MSGLAAPRQGPAAPRLESHLRSEPRADAEKTGSGSRPNSSPAQANAGADFHLVPVDRDRLRACSSPRSTDLRTLGRAAACLGIPAVSVRRQLSAAACRWHRRHGRPARADNHARPISFHTQSDVSRTSDLHVGPHADILVLARTCHLHWPRILVPSARAARRSSAGEDIWRRIRRLSSTGEAMDSQSFVNLEDQQAKWQPLARPGKRRPPAAAWSGYGCKPAERLTRSESILMTRSCRRTHNL